MCSNLELPKLNHLMLLSALAYSARKASDQLPIISFLASKRDIVAFHRGSLNIFTGPDLKVVHTTVFPDDSEAGWWVWPLQAQEVQNIYSRGEDVEAKHRVQISLQFCCSLLAEHLLSGLHEMRHPSFRRERWEAIIIVRGLLQIQVDILERCVAPPHLPFHTACMPHG